MANSRDLQIPKSSNPQIPKSPNHKIANHEIAKSPNHEIQEMPYFALTYEVVDDFVNQRTPFRPAHLKEVREANERGELIMAGAVGEPAGAPLVFRAADKTTAERFATNDPYVLQGLVKTWRVRPWTVVVGQDPQETPGAPR